MALLSIRDLTHWTACGDILFLWKHNYYLPAKGNLVVVCISTGSIGSVGFHCVKLRGEDVP